MQVVRSWVQILSGVALAMAAVVAASAQPVRAPLPAAQLPVLSGAPLMRHFSTEDFRASPQHLALATDQQGRLLVGNVDGLLRFDGEVWQLVELPGKMAVRSIAIGRNGRTYIGGYDSFGWMEPDREGGLAYRELQTAAGLRGIERHVGLVWEVLAADDGVYFRTDRVLHFISYDHRRARNWPLPEAARGFFVVGDQVYARVHGQGFTRFQDGRFVLEPGGEAFAEAALPAVLPRPGWRLLIGRDGFYRADGRGIARVAGDLGSELAGAGAYAALQLGDGSVVVGGSNGELFRFGYDLSLRQRQRLGSYGVQALGADDEGGLWVATEVGLSRLSVPSPWSTFGSEQGVQGRTYDFEWYDGALWLATSRGVGRLERVEGGAYQYSRMDWVELEANALLATPAGLLIAHRDGLKLHRKGASTAEAVLEAVTGGVYGLLQSERDPSLVYAVGQEQVYLLRGDASGWRILAQHPLGDVSPWGVEEAATGELWFGDLRGYPQRWRLDPVTGALRDRTVFDAKRGISADPTGGSSVYRLDGRIFMVVGGQNFRFDGQRFVADASEPFTRVQRPGELTVRETPLGAYAYTTRQLFHRPAPGQPWQEVYLNPDVAGGYSMLRFNADGVLRISTWSGLLQYDPTERAPQRPALKVAVDSVRVRRSREAGSGAGEAVAARGPLPDVALPVPGPGEVLRVPAGNSLSLRFAMVSMEAGAQFRYRLAGVSPEWSSWNNNVLFVRALPAGRYQLEVEGRTRSGQAAESTTMVFEVQPFWYETWWTRVIALLAGVLATGAMVFLLTRHRTRQYLQANRELESRIADRTRELEDANRQLTELAIEDPLTGIANRRALEMGQRREWYRCIDQGRPLSALMIDVDHFKRFNDAHGHLEGDLKLKQVAQLLALHHDSQRELLARYGGEEFSLLLPGVYVDEAWRRAETMRRAVAESDLGVTVSIGLAGFVPGMKLDPDSLLRRADAALYRAKRSGRNRVAADTD